MQRTMTGFYGRSQPRESGMPAVTRPPQADIEKKKKNRQRGAARTKESDSSPPSQLEMARTVHDLIEAKEAEREAAKRASDD